MKKHKKSKPSKKVTGGKQQGKASVAKPALPQQSFVASSSVPLAMAFALGANTNCEWTVFEATETAGGFTLPNSGKLINAICNDDPSEMFAAIGCEFNWERLVFDMINVSKVELSFIDFAASKQAWNCIKAALASSSRLVCFESALDALTTSVVFYSSMSNASGQEGYTAQNMCKSVYSGILEMCVAMRRLLSLPHSAIALPRVGAELSKLYIDFKLPGGAAHKEVIEATQAIWRAMMNDEPVIAANATRHLYALVKKYPAVVGDRILAATSKSLHDHAQACGGLDAYQAFVKASYDAEPNRMRFLEFACNALAAFESGRYVAGLDFDSPFSEFLLDYASKAYLDLFKNGVAADIGHANGETAKRLAAAKAKAFAEYEKSLMSFSIQSAAARLAKPASIPCGSNPSPIALPQTAPKVAGVRRL